MFLSSQFLSAGVRSGAQGRLFRNGRKLISAKNVNSGEAALIFPKAGVLFLNISKSKKGFC